MNEGKGGLKLVTFLINILLFFFLLSPTTAQINLNGFGAVNKIPSFKNKQKIAAIDYNQDSITDLITFGSKNERITLHPGSKNGYDNSIDKFFFYLISDLKKFNNFDGLGQHHIFISRKEKLAGLISFTPKGTINLLNKIEFESYPSVMCTGDINNDGILEAIIGGTNFNGISILTQKRFKLFEERLLTNRIFSTVNLIDLDYDGYPELIAFDELENSIIIFANDEGNGFRDERKIKLNDKLLNQIISDFNNDGFIDIIYSTGSSINAIYGDSVSSFENTQTLIDDVENSDFIFKDINNDDKNDFLFLDKNNSQLLVSTALTDNEYSKPILLFKSGAINDFIPLTNNKESICLVDSDGYIYQIYTADKKNNLNIAASCSPDIFGLVNAGKKMYLYYFDEKNSAFILFLLNNQFGIAKYYKQNITTGFSKIKIAEQTEENIRFICFNGTGKHFDEILFNTQDQSLSTKRIFTKQKIIDADYFSSSITNGLPNRFAALTLSEGELRVESYNTNTQSLYTEYIDSNVVAGLIIAGNTDTTFYWTQKDSTIKFIRSFLQPPSSFISDTIFETDTSKVNLSNLNSEWMNDSEKVQMHSFMNSNENSFILLNSKVILLSDLFLSSKIEINNLKLSYRADKNQYSLWGYQNNSLSQYQVDLENKKVKLIYYIDYLNCKDYFAADFNKSQILIYTNTSENYFSLQKIE
ncbi:MAG: VCBS repeat-containing protein [Ignavibacteriae bacterium]|nr:VCBS repeat-containing protein [Ignavibacteriota bacterium]